MDKIVVDKERCKGCSLCVIACPKKSIELSAEFNTAGYHPAVFNDSDECTGCGFCYIMCPDVAIEVWK